MWVERVTARAFGPFRDATLELAPGLTVVCGPNEAGKSSWHAALGLALTGLRRGRGAKTADARRAEKGHRPWDDPDGGWEVGARLHLDDGRVIEIAQDLAGRVDCRAVDVTLGRDVSAEIIHEGSPDASRWLGLDRNAFDATIMVDQAQILAVVDAADGLQDDMQRAAATAGRDATAAEAITRLAEFRRESVGADTRVAVGPLRQAKAALAEAEAALADARERHDQYLARSAEAQAAADRLAANRRAQAAAEAMVATARATALGARARRAAELAALHPAPPRSLPEADADTAAVAVALEAWQARPRTAVLEGPDSQMLERELARAAPPVVEPGDTVVHPSVLAALRDLDQAEGAAAELDAARPRMPGPVPSRREALSWTPLFVAGAAVALGAVAIVVGLPPVVGLALVALGIGAGAWAVRRRWGRREFGAGTSGSDWVRRRGDAAARVAAAAEAVRAALEARGAPAGDDPRAAAEAYAGACALRAEAAMRAVHAEALRAELEARRQLEGTAAEAAAAVARAEELIRTAARQVGRASDGSEPGRLAEELADWQRDRAAALRDTESAIAEWQELTDLLDGRTLAELEAAAREAATAAAAGADPGSARGAVPTGPGPLDEAAAEAALAVRRSELLEAERRAAALDGEVGQLMAGLPGVSEAEEAVDAAGADLARVLALSGTIDEALELLRAAEEEVHRDLAPILKAGIERWLADVSGAAYTAAAVDPSDLGVQVREAVTGRWRDAQLLSEGTKEQVYLLLRVAMAEHLVTTGETAPLYLDEVTAQADDDRRERLLAMLRHLAAERQVVLFTHDTRIADWADAHRDPARDLVVRLSGPAGS